MKFIEYAALSNHLEKEGSSVNKFVKEVTGEPLNEADDKEIETSRAGKGFHSPKFAMKRKKLNNLAKQFLKAGKEKIIAKYAPKILGSTKNLITKAAALNKEGKSPEEINKLLANEAQKGIAIQDKSIARLDQIIDKLASVYEKRVNTLISGEKSGLSEKSQGQLDMYWSLLSLQVRQALDKSLVKYREDMIDDAVGNNPEMEKMLKLMAQSPNWKQKMEEYTDEIEKVKKEYKAAQGKGSEDEFKVEKDQKYKINDKTYEIIEVMDDGTLRVKGEKGTYKIPKDHKDYSKFTKENLQKEEIGEPEKAEA